MLGLAAFSRTTNNLLREKRCVFNLPSDDMIPQVNALARTTGSEVVPDFKVMLRYRHDKDKFKTSGLTPLKSELVRPDRILECPVQMEAELVGYYEMMTDFPKEVKGFSLAVEVRVKRTYVREKLRLQGHENRIDPEAWRPMIMSFQHLYGLRNGPEEKSTLANIDEELYRLPVEKQSRQTLAKEMKLGNAFLSTRSLSEKPRARLESLRTTSASLVLSSKSYGSFPEKSDPNAFGIVVRHFASGTVDLRGCRPEKL